MARWLYFKNEKDKTYIKKASSIKFKEKVKVSLTYISVVVSGSAARRLGGSSSSLFQAPERGRKFDEEKKNEGRLDTPPPSSLHPRFPGVQFNSLPTDRRALLSEGLNAWNRLLVVSSVEPNRRAGPTTSPRKFSLFSVVKQVKSAWKLKRLTDKTWYCWLSKSPSLAWRAVIKQRRNTPNTGDNG